ncbi:hypothetical protein CRYUN_Cryun10bG0101800 [Craigia yunnanensis]
MEPVPLSTLSSKTGKCSIEVKILRIWKSINPKANNQLICHDFLAVDEENNAIQGVIKPSDMMFFDTILEKGKVFIITSFFVTDKKKSYNVIPNSHKINFVRTTKVVISDNIPELFPTYHFNFADMQLLESRLNSNEILSDTITVTLWAEFAQQLLDEDFLYKDEASIVVFAAVTVSKYMIKLTIATCSASRIIVNPDIPEAIELKQSRHHYQAINPTPKRQGKNNYFSCNASDTNDTKICKANIFSKKKTIPEIKNAINGIEKLGLLLTLLSAPLADTVEDYQQQQPQQQ